MSGAPAIKEARTTRVAGPHAEFQTSGARKSAARRNLQPSGAADGASFGKDQHPPSTRHCQCNFMALRQQPLAKSASAKNAARVSPTSSISDIVEVLRGRPGRQRQVGRPRRPRRSRLLKRWSSTTRTCEGGYAFLLAKPFLSARRLSYRRACFVCSRYRASQDASHRVSYSRGRPRYGTTP